MEGASGGGSLEQTRLEVRQGVSGMIRTEQKLVWDRNSHTVSLQAIVHCPFSLKKTPASLAKCEMLGIKGWIFLTNAALF